MKRLLIPSLLLGLLVLACQRPTPGDRPGPNDRERHVTVGPTFPGHAPGAKTIYLGVAIRHPDVAGVVRGRIGITMDALDTVTQFHGFAAGQPLPWEIEVDSGFEYPMDINPGYPNQVLFTITGIIVGRKAGERVECWIRDKDYAYYDQDYTLVNKRVPSAPARVHCSAFVNPPPPLPAG